MSSARRTFIRTAAQAGTACWLGARTAGGGQRLWSISRDRFPRIEYDRAAPEPVRFAAQELGKYLRRVLGLSNPAPGGASGPAIVLECVEDAGLGDEGFELSCDSSTLRIRGSAAGVAYGAFEFLRSFAGCSFAGVGPDCEDVPRRTRIDVDVPVLRMRPRLWYRGYQFFYPEPLELSVQRLDWMVKNGLNYVMYAHRPKDMPDRFTADDPYSGVSLAEEPISYSEAWIKTNLIPEALKRGLKLDFNLHNLLGYWMPPDRYFDEHPEWYALVNGKRIKDEGKQLAICTSNADGVATLVANVKQFLRENPRVRIVGVIPEDSVGMCQCDACVRNDPDPRDAFRVYRGNKHPDGENRSKSLRYARLINQVAREIRDEHPSVLVGSAAYVDLQWPPPGLKLEPNVVTWFALYGRDGAHPVMAGSPSATNRFFFDLLAAWRRAHPGRLILYEYYMGMEAQRSLPYPMAEVVCRDWEHFKKLGVEGALVQSWSSNHNSYALTNLAFARSGWQDHVDYDALATDCLRGMFGSAANELAPVFARMQQALKRVETGEAGSSLYLSTYSVADVTRGSYLPDAFNIGYLLEQIGGKFLDDALAAAKRKAATEREKRQVEYFTALTVYWRKTAAALTFDLRAEQARRDGDNKQAAALLRQALASSEEALRYMRTLGPRGWISVTTPRAWRRAKSALNKRLAAVS